MYMSFCLCNVIDFGEAEGRLVDKFNHVIESAWSLSNVSTTRSKRNQEKVCNTNWYQEKFLFCLHEQFLSPLVDLIEKFMLTMEEYQRLCDSIWLIWLRIHYNSSSDWIISFDRASKGFYYDIHKNFFIKTFSPVGPRIMY